MLKHNVGCDLDRCDAEKGSSKTEFESTTKISVPEIRSRRGLFCGNLSSRGRRRNADLHLRNPESRQRAWLMARCCKCKCNEKQKRGQNAGQLYKNMSFARAECWDDWVESGGVDVVWVGLIL